MKLHQTIALALVGWCLMAPPTRILDYFVAPYIDWDATRPEWQILYQTDSRAICEKSLKTAQEAFPAQSRDRQIFCAPCKLDAH
jgi:hypothetical protein